MRISLHFEYLEASELLNSSSDKVVGEGTFKGNENSNPVVGKNTFYKKNVVSQYWVYIPFPQLPDVCWGCSAFNRT